MVVDADQRRAALDVNQSFCVSAPAGSGKTELLTQRFLKLLATVDEPEQVLAITFTRKAKAEMTARIIRALILGEGPEPTEAYLQTTWLAARAALARDASLGWHVLKNPSRLRIQTIDSLNQSIAAESPLMNGLGAVPVAVDNAHTLYRRVIPLLLSQLKGDDAIAAALSRVLLVCDGDLEKFSSLLFGLLSKREQWLHYVGAADDSAAIASALRSSLNAWLLDDMNQAYEALLPYQGELITCLSFATQHLKSAELAAIETAAELPLPAAENLSQWQAIAAWLLTDKNEFRKTVSEKQGFPAPSSQKKGSDLQVQYADGKRRITELLKELRSSGIDRALATLRLAPESLTDDDLSVVQDILLVLRYAVAHLNIVFSESGECDHTQVALAAAQLLQADDSPSATQLRWHSRVRHILIDEYQDTSLIQNQILASLVALWAEARELNPEQLRTLFVVGDGMQSIYRFRAANVGLFIQAKTHGIGSESLQAVDLQQNFRSVAPVVEHFNRIFGASFPSQSEASVGAVNYSDAVAIQQDTGAVECHGFATDLAEARYIASAIAQYQQENPDHSVAVLARARPHLRQISTQLQQHGISFSNTDILPLSKIPAVVDAMSITRWLLDIHDDIAFASILRAPWCGATAAELHALKQLALKGRLGFCADADLTNLPAHIQTTYGLLVTAWAERGRKPLADAVFGVWQALGGEACAAAELVYVEQYIRLLRSNSDIEGLEGLQAALEGSYAEATELSTRVQLMTIHKSKGLEFDAVFIVGLGNMAQSDNAGLLEYAERLHTDGSKSFLLAPWGKTEAAKRLQNYVRNLEKQAAKHEALRVLYVGATRAIRLLSMSFCYKPDQKAEDFIIKPPSANSLLHYVWPAVKDDVIIHQPEGADEPVPEQALQPLRRIIRPADEALLAPQSTAAEVPAVIDKESEKSALGVIIHAFLEQAASVNSDDLATLINYYDAQIDYAFAIADKQRAKQRLRRVYETLNTGTHAKWVFTDHPQAVCEWEITAVNVDNSVNKHIIDRSFISDGVRWIIDYKIAEPEQDQPLAEFLADQQNRYQSQLARYRYAVGRLQQAEPLPIKTALYFPLIDTLHEIEF